MDCAIRKLGNGDVGEFKRIRLNSLAEKPSFFGRSYKEECEQDDSFFIQRLNADGYITGCFHDDRLVGITGLLLQEGERRRHKAIIWGVYVDPSYRRQGLSARMLEAVIENLPNFIEQLHLDVSVKNLPAVAFYEKMGFKSYGIEPRARKIEGEYHDEVLMVKFLKE